MDQKFNLRTFISQGGTAKNDVSRAVFDLLAAVEEQAIALTLYVSKRGYVSKEELLAELGLQNLPAADLSQVAAYLAGYFAALSYESNFKMKALDRHILDRGDEVTVKVCLATLLATLREHDNMRLPDRRKEPPVQRRAVHKKKTQKKFPGFLLRALQIRC